ncbi:MAG TPA: TetR family transcriptional regulator [Candidatus Elarobacter sp.]|jgi:AcrR family transcriptional regulator|nr:TetR family transcriptional regulator [Candidatus Elarobacter sp.]
MSRRQVQAEETRRVILDAALALFTSAGYGATSVADIAERAGVALATVYSSVGTKPALLRLLLDRIDEHAEIPRQAAGVRSSNDPSDVLRRAVTLIRTLAERCGDIIASLASAASSEAEIASLYRAGRARHQAGAETTVRRIAALGGLRADITPERATAILATLNDPSMYRSLTGTHGWSFDETEQWLFETLSYQLLAH